ncbi:MAG: glycosyltransferase family 4 protein [Ktedonobacterales bacterium]
MNILVVACSLPGPTWGAGLRNYHLLRALASQHTVSLLALVGEHERNIGVASHLLPYTHAVRQVALPSGGSKRLSQIRTLAAGRSYYLAATSLPAAQAALDEELRRQHFDAVLFESLVVAGYRVPQTVRIILDEHNIEHELLQRTYQGTSSLARRGFSWIEYRRVKPLELAWCRRSDLVLVTSERERATLHTLLPGKSISVVPNGVDIQAFSSSDPRETEVPGRIVFTASFDYYPNVQGALYFAEHCWPLVRRAVPAATWYLVGRNPPAEIRRLASVPGVTVTGSVPAIQPHLAAAQVAVVPLLTGGGTRLKVLEALSMGRGVVSTSIGYEGIACIAGKHLLVADEPTEFAQAVVELLQDAKRRASLAEAGRALVEERYSWDYCGNRLLVALDDAIENGWCI